MFKWLKRIFSFSVLGIFLLAGVFFAIRNPSLVQVDLVFWTAPELSLALYLIMAFGLGAIVAFVASSLMIARLNQRTKRLNRRVELQKQELDTLRKASLTNDLAKQE